MVLSTDHPNGRAFMCSPELIRLLMDRPYRDECLKEIKLKLLASTALAGGIAREYTPGEIATVTRAPCVAARARAQEASRNGRR
jgi:formylmethanofuran dehydrogenase subunit A